MIKTIATPNMPDTLPGVKNRIYCYSEQGDFMPKTMSRRVGEQIRKLRTDKKLTLDKLAEDAGLSKSYLWELENKNPPRPSAEKLAGLAKALGVTVDFLMGT